MLYRTFFTLFFIAFLLATDHWSPITGEIRDQVVAFVDNTAITLSELEMKHAEMIKTNPSIKKEEVLTTMVNRLLLLREAKKIRIEAPAEDQLINEYINIKIKTFIRIKENDLLVFYGSHVDDFQGKDFEDVRDEIENYLIEKELNERLKMHIKNLKEKACIKIQLHQETQN